MARATDPFEGLDEVWIWPVPHPDDPEPKDPAHLVTRIGERTDGVLTGRAEIQTRPQRLTGTLGHRFVGTGPWRKADLGSLRIPTSDVALSPRESWLIVDGVRGRWTADGRFRLGDHDEVNRVASRGREPTAPRSAKDVGAKVVGIGRQYVRFFRGQPPERTPNLRIGDAVEGELAAGGGWLVATQHRTPVADGCTEAWQVRIDHELAVGPLGLGIGLAALGLVHYSLLASQGEWRKI